jgi:hypothetical protein
MLLKHRLYPSKIKSIIEDYSNSKDCKCAFLPFSSNSNSNSNTENASEEGVDFFIFFLSSTFFETENVSEETVFKQFIDLKICGVDGVVRYDFKKMDPFSSSPSSFIPTNGPLDEWYIETRGGSLSNINCLSDIFDLTKTKTTSVWDIYNTFGIEATKQFLIQELKSVMDGVDICHIKLLVERMTYSGTIEPITRYTMRSDESPLSRASFEESFQTFLKSAKYNEEEPFDGVSAAVIGGKKAEVGTYMCNVFMDLNKLMEVDNTCNDNKFKAWEELEDTIYEENEEDELVYVD